MIGDTSQLSLQTMLGAFNRVTCATEMVGVSWKNPKEKGTTGREGCPLLVFLAMGGYDEELLPVGAEDINIMRRMAVLGKVVWFSGEWVGFSLPNVMDIDEAKGKAMMDTYKARRSDEPAERAMSIQSTVMQGMTWDQMNLQNLQTTAERCKKGEWEANVTAERIGVDTLEWWGIAARRSPPTAGPPVVKQARVEAASSAEDPMTRAKAAPRAPQATRTVMLVSFGTRTLAQVYDYGTNRHAIAMRDRLWPRHGRLDHKQRARLFQNEEAKAAV